MKPKISLLLLLIISALALVIFKKNSVERRLTTVTNQIIQVRETLAPQPTIIQPSGLPNKHQIKAAFIPQAPEKNWDQPWQDTCEEAALLTVDYFYKKVTPTTPQIKQSILDMLDFEKQQGWSHDINIAQMATVSSQFLHYQTKIINTPTVEDIKAFLAQDIPVIIPANGKILFKENSNFRSGGPYYHNLTILGYDDTKQQFTVHDVGTQFGAYFKYSYDLLISSIHDFPDSGKKEDINQGSPRALVLLQ